MRFTWVGVAKLYYRVLTILNAMELIVSFDTLIAFMKEFFEKVNFEKSQQTTTKHEKLPSMQRVNGLFWSVVPCL